MTTTTTPASEPDTKPTSSKYPTYYLTAYDPDRMKDEGEFGSVPSYLAVPIGDVPTSTNQQQKFIQIDPGLNFLSPEFDQALSNPLIATAIERGAVTVYPIKAQSMDKEPNMWRTLGCVPQSDLKAVIGSVYTHKQLDEVTPKAARSVTEYMANLIDSRKTAIDKLIARRKSARTVRAGL